MLPEMKHRVCEVHVDYTAVVSIFETAVEQLQKHVSYNIETHGRTLELRNHQGLVVRQTWFLLS